MNDNEIYQQAAAFDGWHRKAGGDLESAFTAWCDSKDLVQRDRDRIWLALHGVLQARSA